MVKHPILVRGYGAGPLENDTPPVIVRHTDDDFMDRVFDHLRGRVTPAQMPAPERAASGRRMRLHQPIHRTFNVVILEAVCDRPGRPRLNPRDIEDAGLVVRRIRNEPDPSRDEAWQKNGRTVMGWRPLEGTNHWRLDPDPARRGGRAVVVPVGVAATLDRIRSQLEPLEESVSPLFIAPPEVCEAAGRTLLVGMVPVTSSEEREDRPPETVDESLAALLMPECLRSGPGNYRPNGDEDVISPEDVAAAEESGTTGTLGLFLLGLRTLQSVLRVFTEPASAGFLQLMNEHRVEVDGESVPLGTYLGEAARTLIDRRTERLSFKVASPWPFVPDSLARRLVAEATRIINAGLRRQPRAVGRFEDPDAVYRAHAFVRVRCEDGCPSQLHWAPPSEPFQIVPWWESGGPVHHITLPDFDRNALERLKPNVAFAMPPALANLINRNDAKKLVKGEGEEGGGPDIAWICSISLPIITLCAFIVLSIFLGLLDLIFRWLMFIKICLPIPKSLLPPKP